MSRTVRFNIVDVFTETPLAGNQLGVFVDARGLTDEQMQALALELGFSESVFVLPAEADVDTDVRIRIFTPTEELAFAGHPVLGAAFVLAMPLQRVMVKIQTGMGVVPVMMEREGAKLVFGRMSQPVPTVKPFERATELLDALGGLRSELPVEVYDNGMEHVFVALPSDDAVAALQPDVQRLRALVRGGACCFSQAGDRVKARVFVPEMGIPEDAATGSAAGPLAVHLSRHGRIQWGEEILISQGVEIGRPSTLYARAFGGEAGVEQVEVGGSAVVVGRGEFLV